MDFCFSLQLFVLSLIVASAMALPLNPYQEKLPPKPFAYQYGVKDEYSGTTFDKAETQDDYGNVQGEYKVQLPDGRIQIVSYTADHDNGFIANVKYGKLAFCLCNFRVRLSL